MAGDSAKVQSVLVTGGAGFIGSNLVDYLVPRVERVRVLDDFSTGFESNLASVARQVTVVRGRVNDPEVALAACEGIDIVFHLAADASVPGSIEFPLRTNEANVTGTLTLLDAARKSGVRRVVYSSSSSVYGDRGGGVKDESLCPDPLSPYAVSKLAGEQYTTLASALFGIETVSLRYFNVFGPRQRPGGAYGAVIPRFIARITSGMPPRIEGTGRQSRDFVYVGNVAEANWLAATTAGIAGEVMNIGSGRSTTLLELVEELNTVLETSITPEFAAARPGDPFESCADIGKAARLMGYTPRVDLRAGLIRTVEWGRAAINDEGRRAS